MYVYMENMNDKNRTTLLKIVVEKSLNLEIHDKHEENQIWL